MTRPDAEEAIAALGRAITALSANPPDKDAAWLETNEALDVMSRVPSPHADKALRPGLNFHQQDAKS